MAINPNESLLRSGGDSRMGSYGGSSSFFDQFNKEDEFGNRTNVLSEAIRDKWWTPDEVAEDGTVTKSGHWGKYEGADILKGKSVGDALGNPFRKGAERITQYLNEKKYDKKIGNVDNPVIQEAIEVAQESDTGDYTKQQPDKVSQPDWADKDIKFMRTFHDSYGMSDDKGGFQGMLEGQGGNIKNMGALMSTMKNMGYDVGDISSDIAKHGWGAYGDKSHSAYKDIMSKLPQDKSKMGWWDRMKHNVSNSPKNPDGSPKVVAGVAPNPLVNPLQGLGDAWGGVQNLWSMISGDKKKGE
jgi:hypothetical protein